MKTKEFPRRSATSSEKTLNTCYAFKADDIATNSSEVMISIKHRRFLIRNLSSCDINELVKADDCGLLRPDSISPSLLSSLLKIGAALDHNQTNESDRPSKKLNLKLTIPSRIVKPTCSALAPLATIPGCWHSCFCRYLELQPEFAAHHIRRTSWHGYSRRPTWTSSQLR